MTGPVLEGEGATDYERYLNIPLLLSVPKAKDKLAHRDELLFQITHQTAELWFHQILWDFEEVERLLDKDQVAHATRLIRRSVEIIKVLTQQIHVLENMIVWDYHIIRLALGRGSGQESPGFNGIIAEGPKLDKAFHRLLERRGVTLYEVSTQYEKHFDLLEAGDALVDFDMYFHLWRQNHLAFVKRIIGPGQRSVKGYGVEMLEKHILGQFLFPKLLEVRDEMTLKSGSSPPGKRPGESTRPQG